MMKHLILFLLFYCLPVSLFPANDIYFYRLGLEDGLSQINIMSIYQDEFGAMWFGSTEGLNRYNGHEIQTFRSSDTENGITQNMIYDIQGNTAGVLYIHADNDLLKFDLSTQTFKTLDLPGNPRDILYHNNHLWVAVHKQIYLYDEYSDTLNKVADLEQIEGNINYLYICSNDKLWVGTNKELVTVSLATPSLQNILLRGVDINCVFEDSRKNIYIGTYNNGLYIMKPSGAITNHKYSADKNSISNNQVRTILEDNKGKIWMGSFLGLNQYDPETGQWKFYLNDDNIPYTLSHNSIFALFKDRQGTIWVGTYYGGISYFNTEIDRFQYYGANSINSDYLSFPFVSKMAEDQNANLWICTEGGALNCLDLNTKKFSRHLFVNHLETEYNNQKSIWYRKEKEWLYIGMHTGGLIIFDTETKTYRRLLANPDIPNALPSNTINKVQYYNGSLFLLTQAGLTKMNIEQETFHPVSDNPDINQKINQYGIYRTFLIDSKNRLWMQRSGIKCIHLETGEIKEFEKNESEEDLLKTNITDIFESSTGDIYFASSGDGIFKYNSETGILENYTKEANGLKSDYCYCVSELSSGNLILLHNKGVSVFDPEKRQVVVSPKFPLTGFNLGSSVYITKNKEIFIGGMNGMVSFFEENLKRNETRSSIYFDKLYLNNQQVIPGDKSGILDVSLFYYDKIKLGPKQNNISIEFASSRYVGNTIRNFEYMLKGFDKNWIQTNNPEITYTNLNAGSYELLVREEPFAGEFPGQISALSIYISPPFYRHPLAFILYFILTVLVIYAIIKFYAWRTRLETTLKYEQIEKERIEELSQTKINFFTNVSHEFRTPLTLISIQLEKILSLGDLSTHVRNRLLRIEKNTSHLHHLITELLDFTKQRQGHTRLQIECVELISYIKEIADSFQEYASKKEIKYTIQCSETEIYLYIDPRQLQKAVYNLLSNAFKYTPEKGSIKINLKKRQNQVYIQVIDNGIGIPAESLSRIFDRFYQTESGASAYNAGIGIGLALTKEIITAHKGQILVESTLNEGSTFTILLQEGTSHFTPEELLPDNRVSSPTPIRSLIPEETSAKESDTGENRLLTEIDTPDKDETKPSVLIIEDNEELLDMLADSFAQRYNVFTAMDGKTGMEMVVSIQPDIVVSDVMMPELSGKELCYRIKNNINTYHIPVVLLTAQASHNQIIEGYTFGADAYLTKPFNIGVLISNCNTLIKNRKLMYDKFFREPKTSESFHLTNEYDQSLINNTIEIIKKNFENPDFDMTQLGTELGMSRSKLYTTIKDTTGFTPNEFTLNIKLQEAVRYIENHPELNISDIAFRLGFSSSKYFSKCFKKFYGITPQEWRKKGKQ